MGRVLLFLETHGRPPSPSQTTRTQVTSASHLSFTPSVNSCVSLTQLRLGGVPIETQANSPQTLKEGLVRQ